MLIIDLPHLNGQFQLLQTHIFDIDEVLEDVSFLFGLSHSSLNRNVEFLKLTFSAHQFLHLT